MHPLNYLIYSIHHYSRYSQADQDEEGGPLLYLESITGGHRIHLVIKMTNTWERFLNFNYHAISMMIYHSSPSGGRCTGRGYQQRGGKEEMVSESIR